jgi:hypothetical protein
MMLDKPNLSIEQWHKIYPVLKWIVQLKAWKVCGCKFEYEFYTRSRPNVSTSLLWQFISSQLANHIKCSDYFDKFSLLTPTDEQNLYFDNFFYASFAMLACMLAFEQVHLS